MVASWLAGPLCGPLPERGADVPFQPAASEASAAAAGPPESFSAKLARLRAEKVERDRLKRAQFLNELSLPELAEEVRRLQRESPDARALWAAHCTAQFGGVKDPLKHSLASLKDFLSRGDEPRR